VTKNSIANGISSLTFKINQLPTTGSCFVDKYNGISLQTTFNIKCVGWFDPDGSIERYEYFGNLKKNYIN
jgi:hypothetical protein